MATRSDAFGKPRFGAGTGSWPGSVFPSRIGPATALFAGVVGIIVGSLIALSVFASIVLGPVIRAVDAGAVDAASLVAAGPALDARTKVYAADGSLLAILHGEENREPVPLSSIPEHVRKAVIAVEDSRFADHDGVDRRALGRALAVNVGAGAISQGGGTITMQLARNAYLHDRSRTLTRKLEEMAVARELERRLTKDQILEQYLNTVYFGEGAYGVAAAAETFFNLEPAQLTLGQAALVAGLIPSPETYSPRTKPQAALARRAVVLLAMRKAGLIDERQAAAAAAEPLRLVPRRTTNGIRMTASFGASFVHYVKDSLLADRRLGSTPEARASAVFGGGLRVHTTLDPAAQRAAERSIAEVLDRKDDPMGAIAVVEAGTGAVRAMAGAVEARGFNFAAQGRRQAGSAFKTFTLVAALEAGIPVSKSYSGTAPVTIDLGGGQTWRVRNYEGSRGGRMSIATATRYSVNAVYAQLVMDVGPERVVDVARRMGIRSRLDPFPSIALGALEIGVSPLEMASAYATLAADGLYAAPYAVSSLTDLRGKPRWAHRVAPVRALDPEIARKASGVLRDVVERGTGRRVRALGRPTAGKTGTTDEYRDAWFAGFTKQLSAAVWLGYSPVSKPMYGVHGLRQVYGGSLPAEIWLRTMRAAMEGKPILGLPRAVRDRVVRKPSPPLSPPAAPDEPAVERRKSENGNGKGKKKG